MMKGQSLIEALLAISVIGVIVSGISIIITSSLKNADFGKSQVDATQSAQEGVEIVKKIRNSSYSTFQTYSGTYCLAKNATSLPVPPSPCTAMNYDKFIRSVTIEQSPGCATNVAKATIDVAWTDNKCSGGTYCHKSSLISCLSKIKPAQFAEFGNTATTAPAAPTATTAPTATSTSISFTMSPNPATSSQNIVFSATVTGTNCTPSGAVYFFWDNQTAYYTAAATTGTNPTTATTGGYPASIIGVGNHSVYAYYTPSGTCPAVSSSTSNLTIQ